MAERHKITREQFFEATGLWPEDDDLERCNCERAGQIGHMLCGWNEDQNMPVFMVGPTRPLGKGLGP